MIGILEIVYWIGYALTGVFAILFVLWLLGLRLIPNNKVGIIEKLWSSSGSLENQILALKGEAGFQPGVVRGGVHFYFRLQYRIHIYPLVTIPQGHIAYVFARDGRPLSPAQTLGQVVQEGKTFQDVRAFLENGGQRGPQREIIREGTYAFNLAQFVIITEDAIYAHSLSGWESKKLEKMAVLLKERDGFQPVIIHGSNDEIGIVTVHDGPSLEAGDIIAPTVGNDPAQLDTYHNNFQKPERFLDGGGLRGRQHQVIVDGTYYINRLFATVELIAKTVIHVGYVGVVISYIGDKGDDTSGHDYKHGELVSITSKGVWSEALLPGKYAFNTFAGQVIPVPTTNIVLKWVNNEVGGHKYDENLMAVDLITKDAFEPSLPLSVVIHIDYRKAPRVIQRFGHIKKLVEQTLDPMVSAYFKNIGQQRTLIQLIQERSEIQNLSSEEMRSRFAHYDLELEEVLIGTPKPSERDNRIEVILAQLRDRQIAVEQVETYSKQELASVKERELKEAMAKAEQQTRLTESKILIEIRENQGKANYQQSIQEAEKIKALAKADAEKEARLGIGKAIAIEEQVRAYGGPSYQVLQHVMDRFSEAVENSGIDIVPRMVMSSGDGYGSGKGYSAFEALISVLMAEKAGIELFDEADADPGSKRSPAIDRLRKDILNGMEEAEAGSSGNSPRSTGAKPRAKVPRFGGAVRKTTSAQASVPTASIPRIVPSTTTVSAAADEGSSLTDDWDAAYGLTEEDGATSPERKIPKGDETDETK
jgi:uncharacterized membrane protein YqiK